MITILSMPLTYNKNFSSDENLDPLPELRLNFIGNVLKELSASNSNDS